jgi:hypothetical protein
MNVSDVPQPEKSLELSVSLFEGAVIAIGENSKEVSFIICTADLTFYRWLCQG